MRGIKPKLSIRLLYIFGCTFLTRKRDREIINLNARHRMEKLWFTLKETTDTWLPTQYTEGGGSSTCNQQGVRSGRSP